MWEVYLVKTILHAKVLDLYGSDSHIKMYPHGWRATDGPTAPMYDASKAFPP